MTSEKLSQLDNKIKCQLDLEKTIKEYPVDMFYCRICHNNNWELTAITEEIDNVLTYSIDKKLWCETCKRDCDRDEMYTKQELRSEKLKSINSV